MGVSEVTAARYYQYGADGRHEHGQAAVHRLPDDVVGQAGLRPALHARLRPRLGLDRHDVGDRREDDRRADLAGPEQRRHVPGDNLQTVLEVARKAGKKTGNVIDGRDHRRHAGGARLAHLPARLPGPERHARRPARPRPRPPAASARSPSRRSTTRSTSSSAAAAPASSSRSPRAGRRTSSTTPRAKGYQYVDRRRRASRRPTARQAAARPLQRQQHDDRVERPDRDARRRHAGRSAARPTNRPAAEPSLPAMTTQGARAARRATRTGSSCRSRAPRSTSRTTPPTRARRSARPSRSTRRSASRSTTSASTRTRSSSSPPTTRTRARSSARTRPATATRPATRTT